MSLSVRFFPVAVLILAACITGRQAFTQTRLIQLDDYAKVCSVSDPQISPDGKSIVFVLSRINLKDDRADRELVLVDIASGALRPLTYDRRDLGSPRWSPNGDRMAFEALDSAAKNPHVQIFSLPMSGGDAKKISDASDGVEQFAWRPDGREIAYVAPDEPANKQEIDKHLDAFEVGDNNYLATEAETSSHLWLIQADGGMPKRLTSGAWSVLETADFGGAMVRGHRRRYSPVH